LPYYSAKNEFYSFFFLNLSHKNSFWLASVQNRNLSLRFPRLRQYPKRKVLIIEANTICFGTTGGSTAHINTLLDTPYDVIKKNFGEKAAVAVATAANDAIELIKNNIRTYNIDCDFAEAKAYLFAKDEHQEKELKSTAEGSI